MKEIKFRCFRKLCEKMCSVVKIDFSGKMVVCFEQAPEGSIREFIDLHFDDIILMQFTGVKDKKGKEIYEGDICEVEYLDSKYRGQVDYKNAGFWIVKHNGYGGVGYFISDIYDDTMKSQGKIKVIGNIYENPEMK